MIKIGKIELEDWVYPFVNGIHWATPIRFIQGTIFDGSYRLNTLQARTMITIRGSGWDYQPEFYGDLRFLEKIYQRTKFSSYEEAKSHIDKFLIKMSRLVAFA